MYTKIHICTNILWHQRSIESHFVGLLKRTTVFILVNDKEATALADMGNSQPFIFFDYVKILKLKMDSVIWNISMASLSLISPIKTLYCQDQPY